MGNLFNNYEVKESINKTDDGSYESFKEGMIEASSIYEEKYKELVQQIKDAKDSFINNIKESEDLINKYEIYIKCNINISKELKSKFNELKPMCEKLSKEDSTRFESIFREIDNLLEDLLPFKSLKNKEE